MPAPMGRARLVLREKVIDEEGNITGRDLGCAWTVRARAYPISASLRPPG